MGPAVVRAMATLEDGAVVVGHSVGGTILIQTLAEQAPDVELAAIVLLAAPFVGDGGCSYGPISPPVSTTITARRPGA